MERFKILLICLKKSSLKANAKERPFQRNLTASSTFKVDQSDFFTGGFARHKASYWHNINLHLVVSHNEPLCLTKLMPNPLQLAIQS